MMQSTSGTTTTPTWFHIAPLSEPICQKMICSREDVGARKTMKEMIAPATAFTAIPVSTRVRTLTSPFIEDSL